MIAPQRPDYVGVLAGLTGWTVQAVIARLTQALTEADRKASA